MNDSAHIKRERQSPKIAVYAIAHNEEHHVERWAASARDADQIVLVDTGSTDRTVQRARELGVAVHEIRIEPFRYDVARNRALAFVPGDIDFCGTLVWMVGLLLFEIGRDRAGVIDLHAGQRRLSTSGRKFLLQAIGHQWLQAAS